MDYQISDKAKKVTLGLSIVGLVMVVVGFFQQKDYIYADYVNEHSLTIKYNGDASVEMQNELKKQMNSIMNSKGYEIEFHDASHGGDHDSHSEESHSIHTDSHSEHGEKHQSSSDHDTHSEVADDDAHHGPTFLWDAHIHSLDHSEEGDHSHGQHSDVSQDLVSMIESGEVSFFDTHHRRFWSNLLVNGFFFFGITLGAIFYLALHYATESGWGVVLLRIMEGIMSAMPIGIAVLLVVFIAGSLGLHHIYPWMDSEVMDPNSSHFDKIIWGKKAYLNQPFFYIRVIAYFATFYIFMRWFKKKSRQEDKEGGTKTHFTMYRRAALFLVFFAVFSSTMSWDFLMSIDTHWFSTLYGWYVFSGMWLSGMVMVMMITLYLRNKGYLPYVKESHIHDVGKWMFALSFLWSYLWFSQFMLIWYANIPEEAQYFVSRIEDYKFIFFGTFFINFFFPMVFLMSADTKRSAGYLIVVGLIIFFGHWLDVFNMVMPGTLFDQWDFGMLEIGMFVMFLGVFVFTVLKALGKAPLLQKNHPFLDESKHHEF
jgi:hypothetical protein